MPVWSAMGHIEDLWNVALSAGRDIFRGLML